MQLLSLWLAPALLLSQVLVGGPTTWASAHLMFDDPTLDLATSVTLSINASYVWREVFDYDNSGNSGTIEHSISIVKSSSYSSQTFNQAVVTQAQKEASTKQIQLQTDVSYSVISASVMAADQQSKEVSDLLYQTTQDQKEYTESYSFNETRTYTVGGNSRLILYQRTFQGPGLSSDLDTFQTTSVPLPDKNLSQPVPLELVVQPQAFVKNLTVVYGNLSSQAPQDRVRELSGGSDDINANQGGSYVWLVPEMTTDVSEAITTFDLFIQSKPDSRYTDIAAGTGGSYRYLVPVRQSNEDSFITKLTLVRSPYAISSMPNVTYIGIAQGATSDINAGRGGNYLYLSWELQTAYVPLT
ncbi:hypothetical protein H0H92_002729 [Tricholoma furcatifolium]|nr:hypothetical protein H0H92_002729 [Tricholoma furcatifolium]